MNDTTVDKAVHTTDTPQVLLKHHLKEQRLAACRRILAPFAALLPPGAA
jgi:hypothetical protein